MEKLGHGEHMGSKTHNGPLCIIIIIYLQQIN